MAQSQKVSFNPGYKKPSFFKLVAQNKTLLLMCLPAVVFFFIFSYMPMPGAYIAFTNFQYNKGIWASPFVGLQNFKFLFTSGQLTLLLRNTILYNLVFIALGIIIPVALAIMINELFSKRASKVFQTMMFFPYFLSWVVVSYFVFAFLNPDKGLLNSIIGKRILWYQSPQYWPFILVFMNLWKGVGYNMVVYLATITGIDQSLYEAAMLDGATKWQQAKYITLPLMKTILITMFILNVGKIFYSDFGLFWQVTQGVPNSLHNVASTFDTFIYSALQGSTPIGRTAAASLFQSVCCCATILLANFIVSKIDPDSAII